MENLQYKLQKRKNHRLSLYCVAASAAFLFLILGVSHIFSLHNNTQNKEAVVAAVVSGISAGGDSLVQAAEKFGSGRGLSSQSDLLRPTDGECRFRE